jgi:hypothetical protein
MGIKLAGGIGEALYGRTRQAVLSLFFGRPDRRFLQKEAIQHIGLGSGTVQRELERLRKAEILIRSVEGRQTYFQADRDLVACKTPGLHNDWSFNIAYNAALQLATAADAELTISVFLVSAMNVRAVRGSAGSSESHQSKAWVSSRARKKATPRSTIRSSEAVQKTRARHATVPSAILAVVCPSPPRPQRPGPRVLTRVR